MSLTKLLAMFEIALDHFEQITSAIQDSEKTMELTIPLKKIEMNINPSKENFHE